MPKYAFLSFLFIVAFSVSYRIVFMFFKILFTAKTYINNVPVHARLSHLRRVNPNLPQLILSIRAVIILDNILVFYSGMKLTMA